MTLKTKLLVCLFLSFSLIGCAHCIHYEDPDIMLRREGGWRVNPWVVIEEKYSVNWCDHTLFRVLIEKWVYAEPAMDSALIDSVLVFATDTPGVSRTMVEL